MSRMSKLEPPFEGTVQLEEAAREVAREGRGSFAKRISDKFPSAYVELFGERAVVVGSFTAEELLDLAREVDEFVSRSERCGG